MKSVRVLIGAMALILWMVPAWAANTGPSGGGQPQGNNPTNGAPANLKTKIAADEKAVHADKEALDAAEQALNADEIYPRMLPGVFGEERGVTAAEFHFQRLGCGKKLRHGEPFDDGRQGDDQIFGGVGRRFHEGRL